MKHCYSCIFVSTAFASLVSTIAVADPVNRGFETGNLTGWASTIDGPNGTAVAPSPTIAMASIGSPYSPIEGAFSALIVAMSNATPGGPYGDCNVDVWNYSCRPPLPFVSSGGSLPTYSLKPFGGAIGAWSTDLAQDITVEAGQKLQWDWQLFGEAACNSTSQGTRYCVDNGWFFATNGMDTKYLFAPSTGIVSRGYIDFQSSGTWSIYFGVGQTEDRSAYSALMLDNVHLVPTPGTLSLALMALFSCLFVGGRVRAVGSDLKFP